MVKLVFKQLNLNVYLVKSGDLLMENNALIVAQQTYTPRKHSTLDAKK